MYPIWFCDEFAEFLLLRASSSTSGIRAGVPRAWYQPAHLTISHDIFRRHGDSDGRHKGTWHFPCSASDQCFVVGYLSQSCFVFQCMICVPVPLWEKCHLCAWHKGIDRLQQASDMPASIKKAISWSRWFNKDWLHQQAFICSSVLRCTITLEYMFCILSEWFKSNSLDFCLARADNSKVQAEDFPFSTCQSAASINILLESSGLRASKQPLSITWARQNPCFRHWKQDRLIQQCMPSVRAASNVPLLKGSVLRAGFTRSKKYHVKNNTRMLHT